MRVLIPIDNNGWRCSNPYTMLLPECLASNGAEVFTGQYWLQSRLDKFDVLNLHWPEGLLPKHLPFFDGVQLLCSVLNQFRQKGTVVATVHNDLPHKNRGLQAKFLYESVYACCDGFIHMGNESKRLLFESFPDVSKKLHAVIPHGNYAIFGERQNRLLAKQGLGLNDKPTAVLMGALRTRRELLLSYRLLRAVLMCGGQVIFAPKLEIGEDEGTRAVRFLNRILREGTALVVRAVLKLNKRISVVGVPVPWSDMARLISAADVMLIARVNTLNSGNLPLGFTYGSVVVGPDSGNVGEILRDTGNVVFPASNSDLDFHNVMLKAFELVSQQVGEANYTLAMQDWTWDRVGQSYLEFFESVIASRKNVLFSEG